MHNSINTQWKPFRIGDLFDIKIGNVIDGNKADKTGRAPYITRKETNNGLDGFIRADKSLMNLSFPVITIGNETAKPFVQNFPFFTGTKGLTSKNLCLAKDKAETVQEELDVHDTA